MPGDTSTNFTQHKIRCWHSENLGFIYICKVEELSPKFNYLFTNEKKKTHTTISAQTLWFCFGVIYTSNGLKMETFFCNIPTSWEEEDSESSVQQDYLTRLVELNTSLILPYILSTFEVHVKRKA